MRTPLTLAALVVALSFSWVHTAYSQVPPAQVTPHSAQASKFGLAVVNISYIFKNYGRFNAQIDAMKASVQQAEDVLNQQRQSIAQEQEKLAQLQPGTPQYKALDDHLSELKAQFNLAATKQQKEFLEIESKIYFQTYLEVSDAVKRYAMNRNIGLVLRFNGDPPDPNNRENVLREINKPVVFQNGIDITPDVLADLNRSAPAGGGIPSASRAPIPGVR